MRPNLALRRTRPRGRKPSTWSHGSNFFATDPVALDRIGWEIVDSKRVDHRVVTIA